MTGIRQDFAELTEQLRPELLTHCYRMLGSRQEAEDLVQETYLNAWRALDGFEGRSSPRTWLYRIATNACLRALERGSRRAMPSGLGGPSADPDGPLEPRPPEVSWLEPMPDTLLDPAAIVESRHHTRLAFIAALQHLSGRQRAVLILRDVLAFRADEAAGLLDTTVAAINSALQRARERLAAVTPAGHDLDEPGDARRREQLDHYTKAFENADLDALLRVLTEDAVLEMPPIPTWFRGRDTVARFLVPRLEPAGSLRLLPTAANGQPAFGIYLRGHSHLHRAHALQVLTLTPAGVARIDMFHDPNLCAAFGLPASLPRPPGSPAAGAGSPVDC
jgi:RNA polymerase sigma-70 factor, ECF subfamily